MLSAVDSKFKRPKQGQVTYPIILLLEHAQLQSFSMVTPKEMLAQINS